MMISYNILISIMHPINLLFYLLYFQVKIESNEKKVTYKYSQFNRKEKITQIEEKCNN